MHGLDHSINFTRVLAIDLGKFNSVACVYDVATHEHAFHSLQTTPAKVHELLVAYQTQDPADTLLVIETCDVSGWVHDIAVALGMRNPAAASPLNRLPIHHHGSIAQTTRIVVETMGGPPLPRGMCRVAATQ
jgi:hypothetical protein